MRKRVLPTNVAGWFAANPAARVGAPAAAVLLVISGLFGGLDPVSLTDRVEELPPGTEIAARPFDLTITQAVAVDEIAGVARPTTTGGHLLMVVLTAENRSDRPIGAALLSPVASAKSYLDTTLQVLDPRLVPRAPAVFDIESDTPVTRFNPGLVYRLALVWEFGGPVPTQLPLAVAALTLRGESIAAGDLRWQDPEVVATTTVPVTNRTRDAG